MRINKRYPIAFIYFFVNSVGLPLGMLYTILLTPFFYIWLLLKGKRLVLLKFVFIALPFVAAHLHNGIYRFAYLRSLILYLTVYIFCYAFYTLITTWHGMERVFRKLLITNFILTLIALCALFTSYRYLFWGVWEIAVGPRVINDFPRLTMFTYEPSYYSTLLVPICGFFLIKFLLKQIERNVFLTMLMVLLPLALSFSMGVIAGMGLAMFLLFLFNMDKVLTSKRLFYSVTIIIALVVGFVLFLFIFYPDNALFVRITAILGGYDGSARGRTYEAYYLADKIAGIKSHWWGVGPGQLKLEGDAIIKEFYQYPPDYGQVSIPCAFAETIAVFGYVGGAIRLLVEIYLFFKTKVLSNYYRSLLFFYIFIYQFTGSFTTNIAEYVIWILAFTNIFPQFDKRPHTDKSVELH